VLADPSDRVIAWIAGSNSTEGTDVRLLLVLSVV